MTLTSTEDLNFPKHICAKRPRYDQFHMILGWNFQSSFGLVWYVERKTSFCLEQLHRGSETDAFKSHDLHKCPLC